MPEGFKLAILQKVQLIKTALSGRIFIIDQTVYFFFCFFTLLSLVVSENLKDAIALILVSRNNINNDEGF